MVLLTLTVAGKAAVDEYSKIQKALNVHNERLEQLSNMQLGSPIEHRDLVDISRCLVQKGRDNNNGDLVSRQWRLDTLLRGAVLYQAPPPPKPEPSPEYKALMRRLRQEEEQRQYERMLNPPPTQESFGQRFPSAASPFGITPNGNNDEDDEVTYADVNRHMILIINVLISIITCSVFIWVAARRWEVPQRLALSMSGSGVVAVAEVAIYMGYIRKIKEAKVKERGKIERKEIVETWVLDGKQVGEAEKRASEGVRFRKGKHR